MQNKYFRFIDDDARTRFEDNYWSNIDISNAINNSIFKVVCFDEGAVNSIQFENGTIINRTNNGIHITYSEMEEFFVEVSGFDGSDTWIWELNETYICTDLSGLVRRSNLNRRFADYVGSSEFKVLAVDYALGSPRAKSIEVNGEKINTAFTQAERRFFKRSADFKDPINTGSESIQDIDQNNIGTVDSTLLVIEAPAKIELAITDEKSRLAAIKFLEGIRFADV